ncbi:GNAT family N-acetyltransferase [Reyranella aquatilis]|uniref:GNAT family N-acetyltransferase n=1 Tax=Reyranella aquatilis TaxID=2035356 RepID=A0ABS8L484_9HYPH|nr:GNAT family N-acetyltransferase [Reyranella aquatilis]MCC8432586.1 GNAT family N-acetyltransferase [Reyranella aquatilis]
MTSIKPVLPSGYSAVPPGHVATVVTSLEMSARPPERPAQPFPAGVALEPLERTVAAYRALYRAVGTDWLWFSRLVMADAKLQAILDNPQVEFFALRKDGRDAGILELDFSQAGECELAFFGVTPDMVGTGVGRSLMNEAIARAWSRPISRFWVHTCTLDHPAALDFYRRSGFVPYAFQVEVFPDPRLRGVLPRDCSRHVPLLG